MKFVRTYNSLDKNDYGLGMGWSSNYHRLSLKIQSSNPLLIVANRGNGQRLNFIDGKSANPGLRVNIERVIEGNVILYVYTDEEVGIKETYDHLGRLLFIKNRHGLTQNFAYDSTTLKLVSVTDPFGRKIFFSYDATSRLRSITLPGNGVITYAYRTDHKGTYIFDRVTREDGASRQYHYENQFHFSALTGITEENGNRSSTWDYNYAGMAIMSRSEKFGRVDIEYSPLDSAGISPSTRVIDSYGASRTWTFENVAGTAKVSGVSKQCSNGFAVQNIEYGPQGYPVKVTLLDGSVTRYEYDPLRKLEIKRIEADGTPLAREISTEWHPVLFLPTRITEPGRVREYTYDAKGNRTQEKITDTARNITRAYTYTYNSWGQILSSTDPLGKTTQFSYDSAANLILIRDASQNGSVSTAYLGFSYDTNGQLVTYTSALGDSSTTQLTYDKRGRLLSRKKTIEKQPTQYIWSSGGQLEKILHPSGRVESWKYWGGQVIGYDDSASGVSTQYILDAMGNISSEEKSTTVQGQLKAFRTVYGYDTLGRNNIIQDGVNSQTRIEHDAIGRVVSVLDAAHNKTQFQYDALNQLTRQDFANSSSVGYTYNALGQLSTVTDPLGHATNYERNGFGEVASLTSPDTGLSRYTLDGVGRIVNMIDARNQAQSLSYDPFGLLTKRVSTDGQVNYTYDRFNRINQISSPGTTLDFAYDYWDPVSATFNLDKRPASIRQTIAGQVGLTAYLYYNSGDITGITYPSGAKITYQRTLGKTLGINLNGKPLLSNLEWLPIGLPATFKFTEAQKWSAEMDAAGRLIKIDHNNNASSIQYDAVGRISAIGNSRYSYDSVGRLIRALTTRPDSTQADDFAYEYDANGNRTRLAVNGSVFDQATAPSNNRLISLTGPGISQMNIQYDAAGNRISDGLESETYNVISAYNAEGRLSEVLSAGKRWRYNYDGLGQRTAKTAPDGTLIRFFYDIEGRLLGEYDAKGKALSEYVYLGGWPIALLRAGKVYAIYPDHLGTPRAITDTAGTGNPIWRWDNSEPFGSNRPDEDPDRDGVKFPFNLRFAGQYYDAETGRHYNYFRDYEPATGRYIQSDPIGLEGGLNTYAYVNGNPLSYTDMLGLRADVYAQTLCKGFYYVVVDDKGNTASGLANANTLNFNQVRPGSYTVSPRPQLSQSLRNKAREIFTGRGVNRRQGYPTISNTDDWNTIRYPDRSEPTTGAQFHEGRDGTDGGISQACMVTDKPSFEKINNIFKKNYNDGGVFLHVLPLGDSPC